MTKTRIPLLTLVAAFSLFAGEPQATETGEITYVAIDELIARCSPVVVSIERQAEPHQYVKLGTGCLVNAQGPVILTCKDVVDAAREQGPLAVGINTIEGKMLVSAEVQRTSDKLGLTALKADRILEPPPRWKGSAGELLGSQKVIGLAIFAADSEIAEGTGALMMGFPLGLGNEIDENHPVCRLGIVAQGVYAQPRFLVDADASRGNSGSPIFLCSTGKFAGLVYAQVADTISILDIAQQQVARMPYGASLAACVPASAIKEFLDMK